MAEDRGIIDKLTWIFSQFPLGIDYAAAVKSADNAYFFDTVLPEAYIQTLEDYLHKVKSLEDALWLRYQHYYVDADTPWDFKCTHDWYYTERAKQVSASDPTKVPLGNLPEPRSDISKPDLRIYCERRAIQLILDLLLITEPKLADEKSFGIDFNELLKDELVFAKALSIEPLLGDIYTGRSMRFKKYSQGERINPDRPVLGVSLRKGVKRTAFRRDAQITPFIRLMMILKSHPRISRNDFSITEFREACLKAYFNGEKNCEHHIPSTEALKPWFKFIFGVGKKVGFIRIEVDENAHEHILWPWEIDAAASKKIQKQFEFLNPKTKLVPRTSLFTGYDPEGGDYIERPLPPQW